MKKINQIIFLLIFCLYSIGILENITYAEQTQKEVLENEIKHYQGKIDQNVLEIIDNFFEENKENQKIINSLKNKIIEVQIESFSLSSDKKDIVEYLKIKADLTILELTKKIETEQTETEQIKKEQIKQKEQTEIKIEETETEIKEIEKEENQKILIVNNSFLNVREGPSTSYKKIEEVYIGDRLILLEEKEGWCRIITPKGTEGWISKIYVIPEEINESNNEESNKELGEKVIQIAKEYIGYPYKYGEESPEKGFDCSGFVYYVFNKAGKKLARTSSKEMAKQGISINKNKLEKGNLLFFKPSSENISHVGIYIGDNKYIHATPSNGVNIAELDLEYYTSNFLLAKRIN